MATDSNDVVAASWNTPNAASTLTMTIADAAATTGANALTEADGHYALGTDWYAVDNNATLATCDFVYLPEGAATGAFSRQFVYTVATGAVSALATTDAP